MSVMGPFFLLIASAAIFWLWREGVTEAPWLREGEIPTHGAHSRAPAPIKAGLIIFLAVALCLFSLMCAAFFMRMESPDWQALSPPRILWLNTFFLVVSSAALQTAHYAARARHFSRMKGALSVSVLTSLLFLSGQLWAWREMTTTGFSPSQNPANAFFFLLTGAHGLHLAGGLAALARVIRRARRCAESKALVQSIELCAIYWHFLLGVWLLLFMLISGWGNDFGVICRRLLY